jgi:gliding motility-associated-like protein
VFTPNGDNVNDFLSVESSQLVDFQVVVLDRFNKTVFKSSDPSFRWDGIGLSGDPVPTGNYVYFITARDEEGKPINKYSTLRIER